MYFDNEVEFRQSASNKKDRKLVQLSPPETAAENTKKIFDENIGDLDWIHSKTRFAELVETDKEFTRDFDFKNFKLIFDRITEILNSKNDHGIAP